HRTETIGVKVSFDGTATIHQANICRVAVVTKLCSSINEDGSWLAGVAMSSAKGDMTTMQSKGDR
ncbi:hypothetical protein ACUOCP_56010, partial [Escherichia sp. R-CC3]